MEASLEEMPGLEDVFEDAITCEHVPNDPKVLITLGDQHYHILTLYKIYAESGRLEDPFTKLPLPKDTDLQIRLYGERNKKYVDIQYETKNRIYVDGYSLVGDVILSVLESLKKVSSLLNTKVEIDMIKGVYFLLSQEISSLCEDDIITVKVKDVPLDELEKEQLKTFAKNHRPSLLSLFPSQPILDDTIMRLLYTTMFTQPIPVGINYNPRIHREEDKVRTFLNSVLPSFNISTINSYLNSNQVVNKDNINYILEKIYKKEIGIQIMRIICQTQPIMFDACITKKYWLFLFKMKVTEGEIEEQYLLALIQKIMNDATSEDKSYIRRVRHKATMDNVKAILAKA